MVCPVLDQASQQDFEVPTEYPYQSLYRPWSWALSTFSNFFLFAVLFLVGYVVYRRRRKALKNGGHFSVSYRKVDIKSGEEGRDNVLVISSEENFGSHLLKNLLSDGHYNVHCLDSFIPFKEDRNSEVCSYIQADVCSYDDMLLSMRGIQVVFHAGSLTPHQSFARKVDFYHTNVTGTENIVRVCRECGVKRLIYTSSATVVVGKKWNKQHTDETVSYPKSHSNVSLASLASAEKLVLQSNGKDGLVTCAMRLAPVICDVNDPFVESLLTQSVFIMKNASHCVTLVDVGESARAHIIAEKKLRSGTTSIVAGNAYNLGGKTRVMFHDLVGKLASDNETIWGQSPPVEVSKWVLTLLAYINYYWYKISGAVLVSKNISPQLLYIHTTELTFSSIRAYHDLGWEDQTEWQEIIASLVLAHKTRQESKKEQ